MPNRKKGRKQYKFTDVTIPALIEDPKQRNLKRWVSETDDLKRNEESADEVIKRKRPLQNHEQFEYYELISVKSIANEKMDDSLLNQGPTAFDFLSHLSTLHQHGKDVDQSVEFISSPLQSSSSHSSEKTTLNFPSQSVLVATAPSMSVESYYLHDPYLIFNHEVKSGATGGISSLPSPSSFPFTPSLNSSARSTEDMHRILTEWEEQFVHNGDDYDSGADDPAVANAKRMLVVENEHVGRRWVGGRRGKKFQRIGEREREVPDMLVDDEYDVEEDYARQMEEEDERMLCGDGDDEDSNSEGYFANDYPDEDDVKDESDDEDGDEGEDDDELECKGDYESDYAYEDTGDASKFNQERLIECAYFDDSEDEEVNYQSDGTGGVSHFTSFNSQFPAYSKDRSQLAKELKGRKTDRFGDERKKKTKEEGDMEEDNPINENEENDEDSFMKLKDFRMQKELNTQMPALSRATEEAPRLRGQPVQRDAIHYPTQGSLGKQCSTRDMQQNRAIWHSFESIREDEENDLMMNGGLSLDDDDDDNDDDEAFNTKGTSSNSRRLYNDEQISEIEEDEEEDEGIDEERGAYSRRGKFSHKNSGEMESLDSSLNQLLRRLNVGSSAPIVGAPFDFLHPSAASNPSFNRNSLSRKGEAGNEHSETEKSQIVSPFTPFSSSSLPIQNSDFELKQAESAKMDSEQEASFNELDDEERKYIEERNRKKTQEILKVFFGSDRYDKLERMGDDIPFTSIQS
eukprot:MONOS_14124.1-p1 / transcript=MONOS_14124.1 / gene=MONOS_14124 / organism=Monocercomonoides_exilis_PA203 / gene_product=unspecified product / transcript_product=unspecified product / location=Mono_scaffold00942:13637-15868(-) / protein_length=743 / sequence_SO=supercontig / SO=protein_coding / is_pseudo=false